MEAVKPEKFEVSQDQLDRFSKLISCLLITEGRAHLARWQGKPIVLHSGISSGAEGNMKVWGCRVIPASQYPGKIYTYNEKTQARFKGERLGYEGIRVKAGGGDWILTSKNLEFSRNGKSGKQSELF